ncbi:MAG: TRAP transporter small permease [Lachnospiraceae bacterium]|nr:TRAP transporter small permease [Lachnospiraceae bacterium]
MSTMDQIKKIWNPIDKIIFSITRYVCVACLAALVAIVFYVFVGRYFLHDSPMWGEPLSLFLLTWMSILGSALVLRTNEHLKVTMFDEKMSKGQLIATDVLSTVCILAFAIFMIVYGMQLMKQARTNTMAGVNIPYAWMYAALPVTGVLYLFGLVSQWLGGMEE